MKFQLPEGFSNLLRTAVKLDPTAKPFVPDPPARSEKDRSRGSTTNPNFVIYNDGVPSMTPQNLKDILAGIDDEAIDENFAPDAQEAAELDIVDQYVSELAGIDMLEDREERARNGFHHIRKRWESRRAHGLSPAKAPRKALNSVVAANHNHDKVIDETLMLLERYSEQHLHPSEHKKKIRLTSSAKSCRMAKSRSLHRTGHKLIQQPQKLY